MNMLGKVFVFCVFVILRAPLTGAGEPSTVRTPWTQSRLTGSPDTPLPYVLEPAFQVEFSGPVSLNRIPETNQYLVCEQAGTVYFFDGQQSEIVKSLCADFNQTPPPKSGWMQGQKIQLFSLAYHPSFNTNRWVYVCYITTGGGQLTQTHVSRFELAQGDPPELLLETELDILTCEGGGHNGCTLAFGNDGYLYISIGDLESPNPPDPRDTGQDISDLYASILRIDVDRPTDEQNYSIPADNPFVELPSARGEVYAYGLRNPFRMSFDTLTGDLWVGDVGWEAWEMVYRVRSGGNYGWAIKEGPGNVKLQKPGPTPILAADIALNHSEAASVTGGMVYRGSKYPDLAGTYIFGDWITRKFWAVRFDDVRVIDYREIAEGQVKPVCFETDATGELLIMDYSEANQAAGIFRLAPNAISASQASQFPRRLSQTGLFTDTQQYQLSPGVMAYQINAPMWMDGARADYMLGIPETGFATFYQSPQKMFNWFKTTVELPFGSVLAKTYRLGKGADARPIETQLSLKDQQGEWQFYTYRWLPDGSDAELVGRDGETVRVEMPQASAATQGQPAAAIAWHYASRTSCRICHTPWTGETIGFVEPQLRVPTATDDSWRQLELAGLIRSASLPVPDAEFIALVNPSNSVHPLDLRARSYLHTNCGHCHRNGGNASTAMDVSFEKLLADTRMLDVVPMRGDLGVPNSRIIAPARPVQSLVFHRVAKSGGGRMPHVGSQWTDPLGVQLLKQWIAQLPTDPDVRSALDELCASSATGVSDSRRGQAASKLLDSLEGAVELASAMAEDRVPGRLRASIVDEALSKSTIVRDLFEPYVAYEQRLARLGTNFAPEEVLKLRGEASSGRKLFVQGVGMCSACHELDMVGRAIGPDLSHISTKLKTPNAMLEAILQPSLDIEEKYRAVSLLTVEGQVIVGRILGRDEVNVRLADASGNEIFLSLDSIEAEQVSTTSLMPEQLLAPLTAQQAADLLAYLQSLK